MTGHMVRVTVNGRGYERTIEPRMLLSDFLRHELSLTGTHVGCEHGVCGSCTVLVDGVATRACLCFAVQVDGQNIGTFKELFLADESSMRCDGALGREGRSPRNQIHVESRHPRGYGAANAAQT